MTLNSLVSEQFELPDDPIQREIYLSWIEDAIAADEAAQHPAYLLQHVKVVDSKTGDLIQFPKADMDRSGGGWDTGNATDWSWQLDLCDWVLEHQQTLILKGRQIGVSWVVLGIALWTMIYKPGSKILVYRQTEDDAALSVKRIWEMFKSLPKHMRNGAVISKPSRDAVPYTDFHITFPDGRISEVSGKPATSTAGLGDTCAMVILDEAAFIELLADIVGAVGPTLGKVGRMVMITTANGVSNPETGEGNDFHHYWVNSDEFMFEKKFLSVFMHPERDEWWYENDPEIKRLKPHKRAEMYPRTPEEAFQMTGRGFFNKENLHWYSVNGIKQAIDQFDFVPGKKKGSAKRDRHPDGKVKIYEHRIAGHDYGIFADCATGRGLDYSVAYVIDLATMRLVAQIRARIGSESYAYQLHYLGHLYQSNDGRPARLAVETQGGYGSDVIVHLRKPTDGRRAYTRLYRHQRDERPDKPESRDYGFPMNQRTRPLVIGGIETAVDEKSLDWLTSELYFEMTTFVRQDHGPSPAAQKGAHDDCVMAAAGAIELHRRYGHHPEKRKPEPTRPHTSHKKPQKLRPDENPRYGGVPKKRSNARALYPWQ